MSPPRSAAPSSPRFRRATPLQVLEQIAPAIARSSDAAEIAETVPRLMQRVIDYDNFRLYRWDKSRESLVLAKSVARAPAYQNPAWLRGAESIALGQGVTGLAARTRRTVLVRDASRDRRIYYAPGAERLQETILCVPMVVGEQLLGVMSLAKQGAARLTAGDRRLMEAVASQTALALANAERLAEAEATIRVLESLDQAQKEFILVASHEFRGPLSVIGGYASMLREGALGDLPVNAERVVDIIGTKAAEMGTLVERMLHVARLEQGMQALKPEPLDLGDALRSAAARMRPAVELSGGRLEVELPPGPVVVLADPVAVAVALDNLLQNAAKFSLGPPAIEARVLAGPAPAVEVTDSGPGIPAEAQKRLFEKFYRVDHPQLRHVGGTGLGLYLVNRLLVAMNGRVGIRSAPGEGATFSIHLPAAEPTEAGRRGGARPPLKKASAPS